MAPLSSSRYVQILLTRSVRLRFSLPLLFFSSLLASIDNKRQAMMKAVTALGDNVGEFVYVGKGDGYGGRLREREREREKSNTTTGLEGWRRAPDSDGDMTVGLPIPDNNNKQQQPPLISVCDVSVRRRSVIR